MQNTTFATFIFMGLVVCTPCLAQSVQPPEKQAVLSFEMNLQALREDRLNQLLPIDDALKSLLKSARMPGTGVESLSSVRATVGIPKNLEQLKSVEPGDPIPFDFMVDLEFNTAGDFDRFFETEVDNISAMTKNGIEYFVPISKHHPKNILLRRVSKRTFRIVTNNYAGSAMIDVATPRLKNAMRTAPSTAVRLVADFKAARPFLMEGASLYLKEKQRGGRDVRPDELILAHAAEHIDSIRVSVDPRLQQLVEFSCQAENAERAASIAEGVNSILAQIKFLNKTYAGDSQAEKLVLALYDQLKAKTVASNISMGIKKTRNFDDTLARVIAERNQLAVVKKRTSRFGSCMIDVREYYSRRRQFPWEPLIGSDQSNRLSWRVRLAVQSNERRYGEINLTQSYNVPANLAFKDQMPIHFGSDESNADLSIIVGRKRLPRDLSDVTDRASETVMLIENRRGFPWMQPKDLTIEEAIAMVKRLPNDEMLWVCFYDYSWRFIGNDIPEETLRRLFDPTDGKKLDYVFE